MNRAFERLFTQRVLATYFAAAAIGAGLAFPPTANDLARLLVAMAPANPMAALALALNDH